MVVVFNKMSGIFKMLDKVEKDLLIVFDGVVVVVDWCILLMKFVKEVKSGMVGIVLFVVMIQVKGLLLFEMEKCIVWIQVLLFV